MRGFCWRLSDADPLDRRFPRAPHLTCIDLGPAQTQAGPASERHGPGDKVGALQAFLPHTAPATAPAAAPASTSRTHYSTKQYWLTCVRPESLPDDVYACQSETHYQLSKVRVRERRSVPASF